MKYTAEDPRIRLITVRLATNLPQSSVSPQNPRRRPVSDMGIVRQSPESSKVVRRKIELDSLPRQVNDCGGKMAMTLFPDTPIFEPQERESLKTNQYVRPYAAITKPQLVGLLIALGEYVCRPMTGQPPVMGTVGPELAEKHRALVDFYLYGSRDDRDA